MKNIFKSILNIILPPTCICCKETILSNESGICSKCWKELDFITKPMCEKCGMPFDFSIEEGALCAECSSTKQPFEKMRCVFKYNDKSKKIILALKYGDRTDTANILASFLNTAGEEFIQDIDIITPVPLHRLRLLRRTYNQSALLASALAKKNKKEFIPDLIIRKKHTKPQGKFTRNVRKENLKGAFIANSKYDFSKKKILLIDDVITTGATTINCIKALKKQHKNCEVYVLALARVLLSK